jgi:HEAT repeat protein
MRYVILLVVLFWTGPSWGSALEQQQTATLTGYLQKGTVREKLLALSLLPKPNCGKPVPPESVMVLQAMTDRDPLVREVATYYVRYEITGETSAPSRLNDEEYFPLSPSIPDVGNEVALGWTAANRRSVCGTQSITGGFLQAAADTVPRVRMESALGLGFTGDPSAVPTLVTLAKDSDPLVRAAAAFALGELRAKERAQVLSSLATTSTGDWRDFFARREALKALRKIWVAGFRRKVAMGPEGNIPHELFDEALRKLAVTTALSVAGDAVVSREAYELLAEVKAPEAMAALRVGAAHNDPVIRLSALRGLLRLAGDRQTCLDCTTTFTASAADKDARVRAAAVRGLGRIAGREHNDTILKAFDDPDEGVRIAAIGAVRSADAQSLEKLASVVNSNKQSIGYAALVSLYRVTRTAADFARIKERRRPAAATPGRSYIWITPAPDRIPDGVSANHKEKPAPPVRLHNDPVAEKIMAAYAALSRRERVYALEVLSRFEHPKVTPFLISCIDDSDRVVMVMAMEIALTYAPAASLHAVAARVASKNERISDAAYRMMSEIDIDFPVEKLATLAEDSSPKTRQRFFELVKGLSDPLLPSLCLKGLRDSDAAVRTAAAGFFQKHADPRSVNPLVAMLNGVPQEKHAAVAALAMQDESAVTPLLAVVTERKGEYDPSDKVEALFGIVNYDRERTVPALLHFLEKTSDPNDQVADNVIRALVGLKERRVVPLLLNYLRQSSGKGSIAAHALFDLADPSTSEPLRKIIECPDNPLERRKFAIFGYAGCGAEASGYLIELARRSPELLQAAVERLQIQKPEDRKVVAAIAGRHPAEYRDILAMIGGASYRIPLAPTANLLHDSDLNVVKGAVLLLRATGNSKAIDHLSRLVNDRDQSLREIAAEAVQYLELKNSKKGQ